MRYTLADDARPHVKLLMTATGVSVAIWVVSWFLPFASYIVYPLQLFATFIHESSHALMTIITGNSVMSLTVSPDGSGAVWSQSSGFSSLLISSAGYLGATAFGILLMIWMRYGRSARIALYASSALIGVMTVVFGFLFPFWHLLANVTFGSVIFTVLSGAVLTGALFAVARYAPLKWANFALAFLSVQCLLNAFFSLKDLFVISAVTSQQTDAANMAAVTGIPSLIWVVLWIAISLGMIMIGMRMYAATRGASKTDTVFED